MQVKTSVHESVVDRVRVGMAADIRLDAFPELRYAGTVKAVAVLPDQGGWLSSDTKVYETIVVIDQEVDQVKPGMTAVVELFVDHVEDILAVPVQALLQRGGETWCYVADGARMRRQVVTLGQTNDKFVEIRSGLVAGDRVVLNPSAIVQHDAEAEEPIAPDTTRGGDVPL
jgi:HlyD family secretion protein